MSLIQFSFKKYRKYKRYKYRFLIAIIFFVLVLLMVSLIFNNLKIQGNAYYPKYKKNIPNDFYGEIFFNDLDGHESYSQVINTVILSAQRSVQIAMYSIQNPKIIKILEQKQKEGVKIDIIVPRSKTVQHTLAFGLTDLSFLELGKESNDDETIGDLMHHKFILIDSGYPEETLLMGSSNLTLLQEQYDPSFLLKTKDTQLISIFQEEFNQLKNNIHGIKKISKKEYNPFAYLGEYSNGFIENWFSPGYLKNSVKHRILNLINSAEKNIIIIGWRVNDQDIYKAIINRARKGITVDVVLDDYYVWDTSSIGPSLHSFVDKGDTMNLFTDSYENIILSERENNLDDTFNSFMHHHTLIIDNQIVVAGTNNWGQSGFYQNDEAVLVTDISFFVKKYVDYFKYIQNKLQGKKIEASLGDSGQLIVDYAINEQTEIIIYVEKSYPSPVGEICSRINYTQYKQGIIIPSECITDSTRVFIVDQQYKLLASTYL